LQLISSILFSLQVFWSKIFILPKKIIRLLESKFNRFLWNGQDVRALLKLLGIKFVCLRRREVLGLKGWLFGTRFLCLTMFEISFLRQAHCG
jgi:hypothetical protein